MSKFDTIVQVATVGLFQAFGVAVAPLLRSTQPASEAPRYDLTGTIAFVGPRIRGGLTLTLSMAAYTHLPLSSGSTARARDLTCELTNQLMGRVKNRLGKYQMQLESGLPCLVERQAPGRPKTGTVTTYPFRTLRGSLAVILEGKIDESLLIDSELAGSLREGDLVLF